MHHSNKAITFGDHSPAKNLIICGGLRNRAPKDGGNRETARNRGRGKGSKGRKKEREREREREQFSFPKKEESKKNKQTNKHETLCQALKFCVTNLGPVHCNYYYDY